ncbi:unnamed protein product [Calicophoron daubneyi]|uniref:LITAF domain-containing protein n=1 Tax=Calicophoron daubneyi TaxID=300641 RepID=A0AAV2TEZ4_CALDB
MSGENPPPYPTDNTVQEGPPYPEESPPPYIDETQLPHPVYPPGPEQTEESITGQPTADLMYLSQTPEACMIVCPTCGKHVRTKIDYEPGPMTYALCCCICLFCGCLGCCLIPFCVHSVQDVVHSCPECETKLGKYSRS